jgi:hypothetical protein
MKLRHITAACLMAALGSAHALTPAEIDTARGAGTLKEIFVSGASALRVSFGAYVQELCTPASFDVFYDDGGTIGNGIYLNTADGINHRAYSCNLAAAVGSYAAGTPVLVYKRDQGGSGQGVTPIIAPAAIARMNVSAANCVAVAANPSPAEDVQIPTYLCAGTSNVVPDGGISDVEPALLQASVNLQTGQLPSAIPATVSSGALVQQLFGIAVNKKAYRALQEAQGIIPAGGALLDVPADQTTWTDATLATIPSLPVEWVRGAITGTVTGGASVRRGWDAVIPASVDPVVVGKTINNCRRVEGSGTQATSNVFWTLNPCQTGVNGALSPSGFTQTAAAPSAAGTNGTLGVRVSATAHSENTSAGNVETCIGTTVENAVNPSDATDNKAYGIAWLGRELNPQANGGDRGYRFVKIDGMAPVRSKAKAGEYPAVFEATMQWNTASPALTGADGAQRIAFLSALRSNVGRSASLAALDADTQQGVMAAPTTYTGAYAALTNSAEVAFGSRVARGAANSCSPLRVIK